MRLSLMVPQSKAPFSLATRLRRLKIFFSTGIETAGGVFTALNKCNYRSHQKIRNPFDLLWQPTEFAHSSVRRRVRSHQGQQLARKVRAVFHPYQHTFHYADRGHYGFFIEILLTLNNVSIKKHAIKWLDALKKVRKRNTKKNKGAWGYCKVGFFLLFRIWTHYLLFS